MINENLRIWLDRANMITRFDETFEATPTGKTLRIVPQKIPVVSREKSILEELSNHFRQLMESQDALRERVRVLEEALREYGECKPNCGYTMTEDHKCDCGLQQALGGGKGEG